MYYGDNLHILREYIPNESIDLIYLDPPFNSNRSYNVLFRDESVKEAESQLTAFEDTWHWDTTAERLYHDLATDSSPEISGMIGALRDFIGANQMTAYLVMMTARLAELHRVLKQTGSLYLHCDPTASHYLKIILDTIFGGKNFRNEIVWCYRRYTAASNRFQRIHDIIFFYGKSEKSVFNDIRIPYTDKGGKQDSHYRQDEEGRWFRWQKRKGKEPYKVYLSEGVRLGDWWEIQHINASSNERLGYPTQKPLALLERIISASSNEGDIILDPFSGCGTAVVAANKLNRKWIGIDITHLAVALLKYRLKDAFGVTEGKEYQVIGEPKDVASAGQLAHDDRYQFQWWALSLIQAKPVGGDPGSRKGKKGKDRGIDGIITFIDDPYEKPKQVIVQVKSGKVKSGDIRDLTGTAEREKAAIGVFITLESPSKDMQTEAVSAGFYKSPGWNRDYPKIQILTIEELFSGAQVQMPPVKATFKSAQKEITENRLQDNLW